MSRRSIGEGGNLLRSFAYDPANRLTGATDRDNHTIALAYDQADRPTQIDDGLGSTTTRSYDSRGNLTSTTDQRGTQASAYNDLDRLTSLTDPQGQEIGFAYDAEGNLTSQVLPNGITTTKTYDGNNRLVQTVSKKDSTTLDSFTYTYDSNGNRLSTANRTAVVTTYAYDDLDRLIQTKAPVKIKVPPIPIELHPGTGTPAKPSRAKPTGRLPIPAYEIHTYAYDQAGNRTQADSKTYDYNALNELASSSDGTTYTYDQAGRLTQKTKNANTTTYSYNPFDELTSADDQSGSTAFTYDALGRRQDRTRSGATEQAHYADLTDIPAFDTDQGGQLSQSYTSANSSPSSTENLISGMLSSQVNLPNQAQIGQVMAASGPISPVEGLVGQRQIPGLLEQRAGGSTTYPLSDAHGDITALADQTGTVTSRQSYDPWGSQTSGSSQSFGYLGQYLRRTDPNSGLIQMGARQYDPGLGRFTSEDQVLGYPTLGQSLNRHSYVYNRPLVMYDLDGRSPLGCLLPPILGQCEPYEDVKDAIKNIGNKLPEPAKSVAQMYCGVVAPLDAATECHIELTNKVVNAGRSYLEKLLCDVSAEVIGAVLDRGGIRIGEGGKATVGELCKGDL